MHGHTVDTHPQGSSCSFATCTFTLNLLSPKGHGHIKCCHNALQTGPRLEGSRTTEWVQDLYIRISESATTCVTFPPPRAVAQCVQRLANIARVTLERLNDSRLAFQNRNLSPFKTFLYSLSWDKEKQLKSFIHIITNVSQYVLYIRWVFLFASD